MDTAAMRALMESTALQALRERYAGRAKVIVGMVIAFWVVVAVVAVALVGPRSGGGRATATSTGSASAGAKTPSHGPAGNGASHGSAASKKPIAAVQALRVVKAEAFGSRGVSDGDNPRKTALVLVGKGTPWQTSWYATSHFAGLKSGTGLLLDMGKTVSVTTVTLRLATGSAGVIVRVGNKPVPGTFTLLRERTGVGGTVTFQGARPLTGRYIEIWFTVLPRDAAGTYQESVYGVKVTGQP